MKIVLAGGTGHLGRLLVRALSQHGHQIVVLSRGGRGDGRVVAWDGRTLGAWAQELDGADAVINLAGRSVNCRYTKTHLQEMMDSRVQSTRVVGHAIAQAAHPPRIWLQMSTATIYAHRFDAPNDEATGRIGGKEPGVPQYWRSEHRHCSGVGRSVARGDHAADAPRGAAQRDGDVSGPGRSLRCAARPHAMGPGRSDCRGQAVHVLDSRP